MKVVLIAVAVVCAGLCQAKVLRQRRSADCSGVRLMDLVHRNSTSDMGALEDVFFEMIAAASMIPAPLPFTCDNRLLQVGACFKSIGDVAKVQEGAEFVEKTFQNMRDLAALSIQDPHLARGVMDAAAHLVEKSRADYIASLSQAPEAQVKRGSEEYRLNAYDEMMKSICSIGTEKLNHLAGFLRAVRVLTMTEHAEKFIGSFLEGIGELIRVYKIDPEKAKSLAKKWSDDMEAAKQKIHAEFFPEAQVAGDKRNLFSNKAAKLLDVLRKLELETRK